MFRGFAGLYPDRFVNVTNGIAVRRWLKQSNPGLSALLSQRLGSAWENDLEEIGRLVGAAEDPEFRRHFRGIKRTNKLRLAEEVRRRTGRRDRVDSMFDVQVKRIHEYKRQLLNLLYMVDALHPDPQATREPRSCRARSCSRARRRPATPWRRRSSSSSTTSRAPSTPIEAARGKLQVVFLPDYDVSLAQKIMPAADLSQQISTAGMEASGTGNMKLALSGALTIGTLDGANIEIRDHVGAENIFIFGMTADEAAAKRAAGYQPWRELEGNPALGAASDLIESGYFSKEGVADAQAVVRRLKSEGEPFLVLADFAAYAAAQRRVDELYDTPDEWSRKAVLNCLNMGYFSSDRAVREYADRIWNVRPVI